MFAAVLVRVWLFPVPPAVSLWFHTHLIPSNPGVTENRTWVNILWFRVLINLVPCAWHEGLQFAALIDCTHTARLHCTLTLARIQSKSSNCHPINVDDVTIGPNAGYFISWNKGAPKSELLSHSHKSSHSSGATKLRSPPTGSLGFCTPGLHNSFHITSFSCKLHPFQTKLPLWKHPYSF